MIDLNYHETLGRTDCQAKDSYDRSPGGKGAVPLLSCWKCAFCLVERGLKAALEFIHSDGFSDKLDLSIKTKKIEEGKPVRHSITYNSASAMATNEMMEIDTAQVKKVKL